MTNQTHVTHSTAKHSMYRGAYQADLDIPVTPAPSDDDNLETAPQADNESDPVSVEEKTFKKRYGDLRRWSQTEIEKLKDELETTKTKLATTTKAVVLPKTAEEVEAWRKQYPEIFDMVRTIARIEAKDERTDLDKRFEDLEKRETGFAKEQAYKKLLELHPDFDVLRESEDFHNWVAEQTPEIKSWLYDNETDPYKASRAIDLYKLDTGLVKSKRKDHKPDVDGSKAVNNQRPSEPSQPQKRSYKISEIRNMKPKVFEKYEEDIMLARAEGRILYDE